MKNYSILFLLVFNVYAHDIASCLKSESPDMLVQYNLCKQSSANTDKCDHMKSVQRSMECLRTIESEYLIKKRTCQHFAKKILAICSNYIEKEKQKKRIENYKAVHAKVQFLVDSSAEKMMKKNTTIARMDGEITRSYRQFARFVYRIFVLGLPDIAKKVRNQVDEFNSLSKQAAYSRSEAKQKYEQLFYEISLLRKDRISSTIKHYYDLKRKYQAIILKVVGPHEATFINSSMDNYDVFLESFYQIDHKISQLLQQIKNEQRVQKVSKNKYDFYLDKVKSARNALEENPNSKSFKLDLDYTVSICTEYTNNKALCRRTGGLK